MRLLRILGMALRLGALGLLYLVLFTVAYGLLVPAVPAGTPPGEQPIPPALAFVLMAGLNTAVMAWVILRSRWFGWRLASTLIGVFWGVQSFMPLVETVIFPSVARRLPEGMFAGALAAGLVHAGLFLPLAILVLGKWKFDGSAKDDAVVLAMPAGAWAAKVGAGILAYVTVYFVFGYYLAWRNPAITAYYQGTDPGTLLLGLRNVMRETPWLPLAQALRGLLGVLLALPIIRMSRGTTGETALAVGALFAVVMNAGLLLPNPYMPYEVRMIHLVETATSNFLFGVLVGWMFARSRILVSPHGVRNRAA